MAKKCRVCGKRFSTDIALRRHIREQHKGYYYGIRITPIIALLIVLAVAAFLLINSTPGAISSSITTGEISTSSTSLFSPSKITQSTSIRLTSGTRAPDFELPEIDELGLTGKSVRLSQFAGKPVFLEFISSMCGHCIKMAPVIKDLEEKYGDRVVFVSVVWPAGGIDYTSRIIGELGLNWVHVVDEKAAVFNLYGVAGTPTYVILNRDHVEVKKIVGETTEDQLEAAILSALGQ